MAAKSYLALQFTVFALVSAAFTNIYLTQPLLPVLREWFGVDLVVVSLTVSVVVLGIALANIPFGILADRLAIQPIILSGGLAVALGGLVCAATGNLHLLIAARFVQGLFIPALTTCLAAYLARTLPGERLTVVMGSYVSATVVGGLGGRLIGGLLLPPEQWRAAFVIVAVLTLVTAAIALKGLPRAGAASGPRGEAVGLLDLLKRWDLVRVFLCAGGAFAVFSSVFNYLPFRLTGPPFGFSTRTVSLLYLVYIIGVFIGPLAGRASNRFGGGASLVGGSLVTAGALALILVPDTLAVAVGLLGLCAGFFTIHAAAVGSLNARLSGGQGRANALYVLFYYLGGWLGITLSGLMFERGGWAAVVAFCAALLIIPLFVGLAERRRDSGRLTDRRW